MLCVTNLDPGNRVLQDNYDSIVAEYMDQDIEAFGVKRYFGLFEYTDGGAMMAAGFPLFQGVALDPSAALIPKILST